jgi:hypothetical protein
MPAPRIWSRLRPSLLLQPPLPLLEAEGASCHGMGKESSTGSAKSSCWKGDIIPRSEAFFRPDMALVARLRGIYIFSVDRIVP